MDETEQLFGNYRALEALARGGFGLVYRGQHRYLTRRVVAIKVMYDAPQQTPQEREEFLKEANILELLRHPGILPILDVGLQGNVPYLITEYAPHGSLRQRLQALAGSRLSREEALEILRQVAEALQYAHEQQVIHRDLKPENILFNAEGQACLADFGIATLLSTASVHQTRIIGTPRYMAPEQFRGEVCKESDQYALACIAYELLTGRPPFSGPDLYVLSYQHFNELPPPPSRLVPDFDTQVDTVLFKALAKERTQRYPDVLTFVTALRMATGNTSAPPEERTLQAGIQDIQEEDYEQLEKPDTTELFELAEEWLEQQEYEEALDTYDQIIQLDPDDVAAYTSKGYVLTELGRYDEALQILDRAIQIDSSFSSAHNNKGYTLIELERYEEALQACNRAIRLDPDDAAAYINKGYALSELGRYNEALKVLDQAIRLDPDNATAYINKGDTLIELQQYEEALNVLDQGIQLNPDNASIYNSKGHVLNQLEQYEEALSTLDQAIRLDPDNASSYAKKGYALIELGRYRQALKVCNRAIQLDPDNATSYHNKGYVLIKLNRYEEALSALDQAIQLDPTDASSYYFKGSALDALGRYREAQRAYRKARTLGWEDE